MPDHLHYYQYNCVVQSGYSTPSSSSYYQHEIGHDLVHQYDSYEPHLYESSRTNTIPELNKYETETVDAQVQPFNVYPFACPSNYEENKHCKIFHMHTKTMRDDQPPEEILSSTLKPRQENENRFHSLWIDLEPSDIIARVLHQLSYLLAPHQYSTQTILIQTVLDMLTLVILIYLLNRWLQFDVLGNSQGLSSDYFLENGGVQGKKRFRRKSRAKKPTLNWTEGHDNQSDTGSITPLSSSSCRQSISSQEGRSSSIYSSRASSPSNKSDSDPDSSDSSIGDELSSFDTSSFSFSEEDITDLENLNVYRNESNIIENFEEKEKSVPREIIFDDIEPSNESGKRDRIQAFDCLDRTTRDSSQSNQEAESISTDDSICKERHYENDLSDLSWFTDHYPAKAHKNTFLNPYSQRQKKSLRFYLLKPNVFI